MKKYAISSPLPSFALFLPVLQHQKPQLKKEKEVKKSDINVNIIRFEKELFACNPTNWIMNLIGWMRNTISSSRYFIIRYWPFHRRAAKKCNNR
ncbi:MAG: hypothetical protein U0T77_03490 [Chitinophagales bacterium]